MSEWRFLAYRPDGRGRETLLHPDLPIQEPVMTRVLSGVNSMDFKISPKHYDLMGADGRPLIQRWGTTIYAERDGHIRDGYIVSDIEANGDTLDVSAVGFLGYAQDMPYTGEFVAYEVDPLDMARFIWAHIQSGTNGNIGLVLDTLTTEGKAKVGIKPVPAFRGRPAITTLPNGKGEVVLPAAPATPAVEDQPFKLAWYETHDLLKDFTDLAKEGSFDFLEEHWLINDGEPQHFVKFGYPTLRQRKPLIRFVVGENVFDPPKYDMPSETYASDVMLLGAGEGAKMIKGYAVDHTQGLLRRAKVVKAKNVGRTQTAETWARNYLAWYKGEFTISDLTVKNTPLAPYGSFDVGDEVLLVTHPDEWIEGREAWVRVMEIETDPANGDDMHVLVQREDVKG